MPRLAIAVRGVVQGVGFRPFVFRQAARIGLAGWVQNTRDAVRIEVEGSSSELQEFLSAVENARDPIRVDELSQHAVPEQGHAGFEIRPSDATSPLLPNVPADLAVCPECLREIEEPENRRAAYPFTSCAHCGPRYSIIEGLPYDRPLTAMRAFEMCRSCQDEYDDPIDRRFHAQPLACPECGPQLRFLDSSGDRVAQGEGALVGALQALREGKVLAVQGLGGFQLLVSALDERAVQRLRLRKRRPAKPFAVMFDDLDRIRACCEVAAEAQQELTSASAPILLLPRRKGSPLAAGIAPGVPRLGVFLPTTPLHHLLLSRFEGPLVCTSGNLSEEPMCVDTEEALERLGSVADGFLVHNRPIVRPVDDSVGWLTPHGFGLLRRARGFAPLPVARIDDSRCILGLGAHLKSSISLLHRGRLITSQHLGDLESVQSVRLLEDSVDDFLRFFEVTPDVVACDLHPDFSSTRLAVELARRFSVPLVRVQHHEAHGAAVLAEHQHTGPCTSFAWDGTGYGTDATVWGCETFVGPASELRRFASLRPFRLPGGDAAARETFRAALGLLHELGESTSWVERWLPAPDPDVLLQAMQKGINAPWCSSLGRLFDAVAALLDMRTRCSYEAEAAVELELLATGEGPAEPYPLELSLDDAGLLRADWEPLVRDLLQDRERGESSRRCAARFHASLAQLVVDLAKRADNETVALSGGCFQNAVLLHQAVGGLEAAGFRVLIPRKLPPNDGSISAGQVLLTTHR